MILVDTRAGSNELVKPLQLAGLPVEPTFLEFGDIAFEGRGVGGVPALIGVEYKKLGELFTAMADDRLVGHQIPGMVRAYDYRYLLVEGERIVDPASGRFLRAGRRGGKRYDLMQGSPSSSELYKRLLTITHRAATIPLFTVNQRATVAMLTALYRFWTDAGLDSHRSHLALYHRDVDSRLHIPVSPFRQIIGAVPEVGLKILEEAEIAFDGSVTRAVLAPAETWADIVTVTNGRVRRVGMKTALKIKDALK